VLLAEDNEINRGLIVQMLKILGCTVDVVQNGKDAVTAVTDGEYDLVLMDWRMPEMDGLEAARLIRQHEQAEGKARLPLVALTANAMQEDRETCLSAGMDVFLSKPLTLDDLRQVVQGFAATSPASGEQSESSGEPAPGPREASRTSGEPAPAPPEGTGTPGQVAAVPGQERYSSGEPSPGSARIDGKALQRIRVLQSSGQPSLVRKVIEIYLESAPELIASLYEAIRQEDLPAITMTAHKLKSSSAELGATDLAGLAGALEAQSRSGALDEPVKLLGRIEAGFVPVRTELVRLMEAES
jgi:CheY-like chemotaxis protein/HPt (histidine-containing phosphotransfer) domain-containing protein